MSMKSKLLFHAITILTAVLAGTATAIADDGPLLWGSQNKPGAIHSYVFYGPDISIPAGKFGDTEVRSFRTIDEARFAIETWSARECSEEKQSYPCLIKDGQEPTRLAIGKIAFANNAPFYQVENFFLKPGWNMGRNAMCDGEVLVSGRFASFLSSAGNHSEADDAAICLGQPLTISSGGGIRTYLIRSIAKQIAEIHNPRREIPGLIIKLSEAIRSWRGICPAPLNKFGYFDKKTGTLVCD